MRKIFHTLIITCLVLVVFSCAPSYDPADYVLEEHTLILTSTSDGTHTSGQEVTFTYDLHMGDFILKDDFENTDLGDNSYKSSDEFWMEFNLKVQDDEYKEYDSLTFGNEWYITPAYLELSNNNRDYTGVSYNPTIVFSMFDLTDYTALYPDPLDLDTINPGDTLEFIVRLNSKNYGIVVESDPLILTAN